MLRLFYLIPYGFIVIWPIVLVRGIYRRFRRGAIVKKLEAKNKSPSVNAVEQAIEKNEYPVFNETVKTLDPAVLRRVKWVSEQYDQGVADIFIQRFETDNRKLDKAYWLSANYSVQKAWEARGSGFADTVSREGFMRFEDHLRAAKAAAGNALELNPQSIDAYHVLIIIELGLGDKANAIKAFNDAKQIDPNHFPIHSRMLSVLSEKWYGSDEEMFEFARRHLSDDKNSALNGLIAMAHLEKWIGLSPEQRKIYFKDKQVKKELVTYSRPLLKGRGKELGADKLEALNYFALVLSHAKKDGLASKAFSRIGDNYTEFPWLYLGEDVADTFLAHKWAVGG